MVKTHHTNITLNPEVCGGRPCIRDTRIEIAVIFDRIGGGDERGRYHRSSLNSPKRTSVLALAYATELSHESIWKTAVTV